MASLGRGLVFLAIFLCTAGFDQGTKEWARGALPPHQPQPVNGMWDWQLEANPGAAFSTFTGASMVLALVAVAALIALAVAAARARPEQRWTRAGYALVAGGALGNLIDRVRFGAVTDFVHWHAGDHHWPIFNVADAALLVGAGVLAIAAWRQRRAPRAAAPA
jgi:signal peptidase II